MEDLSVPCLAKLFFAGVLASKNVRDELKALGPDTETEWNDAKHIKFLAVVNGEHGLGSCGRTLRRGDIEEFIRELLALADRAKLDDGKTLVPPPVQQYFAGISALMHHGTP